MDKDSKFTRDENGYVAVRVVNSTEALPASDKDYLFARDENGNIAMRVVGAGGGGGGAVTSVNGQTGAVVLDAEDVGALPSDTHIPQDPVQSDWDEDDPTNLAFIKNKPVIPSSSGIPQYTTMPTATSSNVGEIAQYSGTTDTNYTNGYFYKSTREQAVGTATISQTAGQVDTISFEVISGNTTMSGTCDGVREIAKYLGDENMFGSGQLDFRPMGGDTWYVGVDDSGIGSTNFEVSQSVLEGWGFTITGTPTSGDIIYCTYQLSSLTPSIDAETFESQISTTGNYDFEASVVTTHAEYTTTTGNTTFSGGDLYQMFRDYGYSEVPNNGQGVFWFVGNDYWYVGPDQHSDWIQINTYDLENSYGVVVTGTPEVGDLIEYVWVEGSSSWEYDGNTVDLNDYGITYTGTAVDGDVLTVSYTQGALVYLWKQTDVQPAGSGGGIDWATHIDKPANAQTGTWNTNSVWEITGGLPDGLYEYYFKVLIDNNYDTPPTVVYKVMFKLWTDNGTQYANGNMSYVIDGDWQPYDISTYLPQQQSWGDFFWKKGSDLIIYNSNPPFCSNIYASSDAVANVFEITAITNVNTGDKYTPTGHLYNANEEQNWDGYIGGVMVYDLVKIPEQTTYCYNAGWSIGQDEDCYIMLGENSTGTVSYKYGRMVSEVDFAATSSLGGKFHAIIENSINSYKAKILEATGDLVNSRLLTNYESGALLFDANFATGDSRFVSASIGFKGASKNKPATLQFVDSSYLYNFPTEISFETVGAKITPENLGVIAQYNGEIPNVAYTKGHFYEATGTAVTVPDAITCEETNTSIGATITCTDAENFINELVSITSASKQDVIWWLQNGYNQIQYVVGTGGADWNLGYNIPESIITTYFSFSPALQSGDYIIWEMTFTAEHQEIQNPAWEEVSVQKSPTTPSTMPTLIVANWSSNTQTVTVNGVTTTNAVLVAPAPASAADWTSAGILCVSQATDSLTFQCDTVPTNDISVNVCILN